MGTFRYIAFMVCVGLLFIGAVVGGVTLLEGLHRTDNYRYRPVEEEDDDEPPPEHWSAGRSEDPGMSTEFEARDEAEEYTCGSDGDGWIYSDGTGWIRAGCSAPDPCHDNYDCLTDPSRVNRPSIPKWPREEDD